MESSSPSWADLVERSRYGCMGLEIRLSLLLEGCTETLFDTCAGPWVRDPGLPGE